MRSPVPVAVMLVALVIALAASFRLSVAFSFPPRVPGASIPESMKAYKYLGPLSDSDLDRLDNASFKGTPSGLFRSRYTEVDGVSHTRYWVVGVLSWGVVESFVKPSHADLLWIRFKGVVGSRTFKGIILLLILLIAGPAWRSGLFRKGGQLARSDSVPRFGNGPAG